MSLLGIWKQTPDHLEEYSVRQIVSFAGDGILRDDSESSRQFRTFLSGIEVQKLEDYVLQCLNEPFQDSGFVLQDLVNELGSRLDYEVEGGRYRGKKGEIGHDGIWKSPEKSAIIVEVKTTDTYRINLDTLARYRSELAHKGLVSEQSSILIVVGREDTGDLEAQIRGSRFAWDIRLINVESLAKLVALKVEAGDEATAERIRGILIPREYTRLDPLIDLVFFTTEDIRTPVESIPNEASLDDREPASGADRDIAKSDRSYELTDAGTMEDLRRRIVRKLSQREGTELIKKSKAQFWSSDKKIRICCTISKLYRGNNQYWYAYHPTWDRFLEGGDNGFLLLGCVGKDFAIALPHKFIAGLLPRLNTTERGDGVRYWHMHLAEDDGGAPFLKLKGTGQTISVDAHQLDLR